MAPKLRWMTLPIILFSVLATGCSLFGKRTVEEAPYRVTEQQGQFELREYEALVVAQTLADGDFKKAGNSAFRKLFAYISGENSSAQEIAMTAPVLANNNSGQKIAMTAPVVARQEGTYWLYQFVLPAGFTTDSAPKPTNPDVTLALIPAKRMAVLRYSGTLGGKNRLSRAKELSQWLTANDYVAISEPQWAGFDPPWTLPPFRRNEVMVELE